MEGGREGGRKRGEGGRMSDGGRVCHRGAEV